MEKAQKKKPSGGSQKTTWEWTQLIGKETMLFSLRTHPQTENPRPWFRPNGDRDNISERKRNQIGFGGGRWKREKKKGNVVDLSEKPLVIYEDGRRFLGRGVGLTTRCHGQRSNHLGSRGRKKSQSKRNLKQTNLAVITQARLSYEKNNCNNGSEKNTGRIN